MLEITNKEHFQKVWDAACDLGLRPELDMVLARLHTYSCGWAEAHAVKVQLGYDMAPMSFSLTFNKLDRATSEYTYWFYGGLIFHPGTTGVDESLSVELDASDKPHWSIHT